MCCGILAHLLTADCGSGARKPGIEMVKTIIVIGAAAALGIITGSASVYVFNRIPAGWLWPDDPERVRLETEAPPGTQRVKSVPWKYVLTATFIVFGIYMGLTDPLRAPAVYVCCLILVQCAMAARVSGRIPQGLILMVLICGIAILPQAGDMKTRVIESLVWIATLGAVWGAAELTGKISRKIGRRAKEFHPATGANSIEIRAGAKLELAEMTAAVILLAGGRPGVAIFVLAGSIYLITLLKAGAFKPGADAAGTGTAGTGSSGTYPSGTALRGTDRQGPGTAEIAVRGPAPIAFWESVICAVWMAANIGDRVADILSGMIG